MQELPLSAKGSPTRKDSLRPEGDAAQAAEGGQLSSERETERLYEVGPARVLAD